MYHAAVRAESVPHDELITGNHFHQPSKASLRDFHTLEGTIFDCLPEMDFIDVAPLQPLGTSSSIAGTDQKMIMPALRRSEVNSDATTSLFREAYKRHTTSKSDVTVATNTRITRVQAFDPASGFLPHFKMFAQVSVGKSDDGRGPKELQVLATHLANEVSILDTHAQSPRGDIEQLDIKLGNIVFTEDIAAKGLISRLEMRRRTQDPTFNILEQCGIKLDLPLQLQDPELIPQLKHLGFCRGLSVLERFQGIVHENHPDLLSRIKIDLGRVAGIGYYRHLCYKVEATNHAGLTLPLVDGGTTDWAKTISAQNKYTHTITSGIGTELLVRHFMKRQPNEK